MVCIIYNIYIYCIYDLWLAWWRNLQGSASTPRVFAILRITAWRTTVHDDVCQGSIFLQKHTHNWEQEHAEHIRATEYLKFRWHQKLKILLAKFSPQTKGHCKQLIKIPVCGHCELHHMSLLSFLSISDVRIYDALCTLAKLVLACTLEARKIFTFLRSICVNVLVWFGGLFSLVVSFHIVLCCFVSFLCFKSTQRFACVFFARIHCTYIYIVDGVSW